MNVVRTLALTSLVHVFLFSHGPGEHRDPDEERFEYPELIFTLADRWGVECDRGDGIGHPGTLVLGNRGEPYRCRHFAAVPRDKILGVSFVGLVERGSGSLSEWLQSFAQPMFTAVAMPLVGDLRWYLRRLLRETAVRHAGFQFKVDDICASMFVDVVRHQRISRGSPGRAASRGQRAREIVARARAHIDRYFAEPLELLTLAHVAGVSPFHFSRLFRRVSGHSPHQYLLRTRLERAAELLRNTDVPILEIALSVGFQDATHFARSFRRHTGATPTLYRRRR